MLVYNLSVITIYYLLYEADAGVQPLNYYDLLYEADADVQPLSY